MRSLSPSLPSGFSVPCDLSLSLAILSLAILRFSYRASYASPPLSLTDC